MFRCFEELFAAGPSWRDAPRATVVGAEDYCVLRATGRLARQNEIHPSLLGDLREMEKSAALMEKECAFTLLRVSGKREDFSATLQDTQVLIQGAVTAKVLLKPFTSRNSPYYAGHRLTALYLCQLPNYHKLIGICCPPVNFPMQSKKDSILTAVEFLQVMGWERPKVAVICEQEELDPKLPNTFVASELDRMGINREIDCCDINGPLSYDVAMDRRRAEIKRCYAERFGRPGEVDWDHLPPGLEGYCSPHCGDFDLLVMPDPVAGHLLSRCWSVSLKARVCPLVIGGAIPVAMRSRGSSLEETEMTIRLAAEYARRRR